MTALVDRKWKELTPSGRRLLAKAFRNSARVSIVPSQIRMVRRLEALGLMELPEARYKHNPRVGFVTRPAHLTQLGHLVCHHHAHEVRSS